MVSYTLMRGLGEKPFFIARGGARRQKHENEMLEITRPDLRTTRHFFSVIPFQLPPTFGTCAHVHALVSYKPASLIQPLQVAHVAPRDPGVLRFGFCGLGSLLRDACPVGLQAQRGELEAIPRQL